MDLQKLAEKYIKAKYPDHDHCAQSERAVKAFLQGVDWCCRNAIRIKPTYGPDIDHDLACVLGDLHHEI